MEFEIDHLPLIETAMPRSEMTTRCLFGTVNLRNFDAAPGISEMDALIAYLQVLGTMVDFSTYTPVASR
jgi:cbb3-type cytochrome oxidase cytochrome c subunit